MVLETTQARNHFSYIVTTLSAYNYTARRSQLQLQRLINGIVLHVREAKANDSLASYKAT